MKSFCEASQLSVRVNGFWKHLACRPQVASLTCQHDGGHEFGSSHFYFIIKRRTYCVNETSLSILCLIWRLFDVLLKGIATDIPLDINTELQDVTLVLANAPLERSTLLWWWILILSSVSNIVCILWALAALSCSSLSMLLTWVLVGDCFLSILMSENASRL